MTYCMQPFLISYIIIFPEIHGKLYAIFAVFREDVLRYGFRLALGAGVG